MIVKCRACQQANRVPSAKLGAHPRCGACKAELGDTPISIGSPTEFEELVRDSPLPVIVDFWATWCGPCRTVAPELERLARERQGRVVVAKLDTDALPSVASRFSIRGIPTMVLFASGKESKRVSGAMSASQIASALGV